VRPATTITLGVLLLALLIASTAQIVFKVGGGTPTRGTTVPAVATTVDTATTEPASES
jgi:hypothetical protein